MLLIQVDTEFLANQPTRVFLSDHLLNSEENIVNEKINQNQELESEENIIKSTEKVTDATFTENQIQENELSEDKDQDNQTVDSQTVDISSNTEENSHSDSKDTNTNLDTSETPETQDSNEDSANQTMHEEDAYADAESPDKLLALRKPRFGSRFKFNFFPAVGKEYYPSDHVHEQVFQNHATNIGKLERKVLNRMMPSLTPFIPHLTEVLHSSSVDPMMVSNPRYSSVILDDLFNSMKLQESTDPTCQGCSSLTKYKIHPPSFRTIRLIYRVFVGNTEMTNPDLNYTSSTPSAD